MTANRRMTFRYLSGVAAALSLALSAPAAGQNSETPVDVTAAPAPSSDTIGPSQLQNFNLQGTVTRQADRPAATSTAPASTAPAPAAAVVDQAPVTPNSDGPAPVTRQAASPATISGARSAATASILPAPAETVTPSAPLEVTTGTAPSPSETGSALASAAAIPDTSGLWSWPWLAALLALIAGGLYLVWSRRGRGQRYAGADHMAFAGAVAEPEVRPEPAPPVRPRPDPVPPRAQPSPRPDPVPPRVPKANDDGMVRSTALKPELNVTFAPDRAVVTEREVMLQFDVVLTNSGAAPARDVLVEAKMVPAHADQDREIAAFFQQPQATGDRMTGIPPFGKVALKSAVRLPLDQLHSFEIEGRTLFVPLVAFNILFRSTGGEGQASASFLVGRGNDNDEKLAPFRLDLGPRIFRGLSARPHSMGLAP